MAIARFEKVSYEQFKKDVIASGIALITLSNEIVNMTDGAIKLAWESIELPTRSTKGSAGYDFKCPFRIDTDITPVLIPTGIRCKINNGWMLQLYPRSGLGFKKMMALCNTVGIIDEDYYHADNEGHIMAKVYSKKIHRLEQGDKFIQGIFVPYGTAELTEVTTSRDGGMGSTGR